MLINKELTPTQFKIVLISACNDFYSEFAPTRWNKKQWITLIETFVNETISTGRYINVPADKIQAYAYASLKNMAYKFDLKNDRVNKEGKFPFFNWLEANSDSDDEMTY
ncbi:MULTISPECIES: hypothetical protein [Bacillus]|uniref:hypothetical protein n=1 Tax=Bacillus TaxID=1386 RepID=UPI00202A103B|nr:hypothetical protein [Bacillus subtilis]MCY8720683.1 hypothetical protein [Bacillus sp. S10C12M]